MFFRLLFFFNISAAVCLEQLMGEWAKTIFPSLGISTLLCRFN